MSCQGQKLDLCIVQGKTFAMTLRWASEPYVYKPIENIANTAPVRITSTAHGMPDGWRFAVSAALGLTELNASSNRPSQKDYYEARVVDANTIEINTINGALLKTYKSGGYIQYLSPVSLVNKHARMQIKDKVGGTVLLSLTSDTGEITLNPTQFTISLRLTPEVTEAIAWKKGVYDLEIYDPADVFVLAYGAVSVTQEVTT
jgi:hypothetical protein